MPIALLMLALLLPSTSIAAPVLSAQRTRLLDSGKIGSDVLAGFDTQERVRVMVALAVPELHARSAARSDRTARREAVRRVRDRVLHGIRARDFSVTHRFAAVGAVAGIVNSAGLAALAEDPAVVRIDLDTGGRAQLDQAVPLTHLDIVQDVGFTGRGVTVAVIDSGARNDHPDLSDSIVAEHCFCEACANSQCDRLEPCCPDGSAEQDGPGSAQDDNGHGTNVTGILTSNGAVAPRGGAPDVGIVSIKVLDSTAAFATSAQVVSGLDWVLDSRPDVRLVNMSLGTNQRFTGDCDVTEPTNARVIAFTEAIDALHASGVAVFASSGNQQSGTSMPLPACIASSISVGAVWDSDVGFQSVLGCVDASTTADQVTCFSNSNASTDVFAPGGPMTSTGLGSPTSTFRGTSQSSPTAAACAAVLLEAHPDLTPDEIELALETSPVMVTDVTNGLSFPRVDCEAALLSLGPLPPTRSPTPSPTITPTGSLPPTATATDTPTATQTAAPSETASLTPTLPPGPPCAGDCDQSLTVSINELVLGVNIALERAPVATCLNLDRDASGAITVDELVMSVNNALRDCG
jgi:subtilisin family serine protease